MPDGFGDTPAGDPVLPCQKPLHWIGIVLKDEDGKPVANEAFRVKLPNGETNAGFLDGNGAARLDFADGGTCQVSFPNIDGDDWQFVGSSAQR